MPSTLLINKQKFIKYFLQPVSKLTDQCVIDINSKGVTALVNSNTDDTILYIKKEVPLTIEPITLNVGNINRFISALNTINEEDISLSIDQNSISYSSNNINFKFHLFEAGLIKKPSLNITKIEEFSYQTLFGVTLETLQSLLQACSFVPDTNNKVYFHTKDGSVFAEFNDLEQQNVDTYSLKISDTFTGEEIKLPISVNVEPIRNIVSLKSDINIKYNTQYKVILMEVNNENYTLKYILSTYIK